jgi:hypothetical protein
MTERSNEIIRQLNRLANDRNLPPQVRNKVLDALQHIKDLDFRLKEYQRDQLG